MARRRTIQVPGFGHANPIPTAVRVGSLVATGVLTGRDPVTREMPTSLDEQCHNVFTCIQAVMEAAGGSTDDIVKLTFWLADPGDREALNREWLTLFPDPENRPARQAMAAQLGEGYLIQCDLLAVLPDPADAGADD